MFVLLSKMRICYSICPLVNPPRQIHPLLPRCFSAPSTKNPNFMAAKVSKSIAHLKSSEKLDTVRLFLKDQGFFKADIKKLIARCPELLCSSPEKTLDPNLRALRDMGLSTSALDQIILSNPSVLLHDSAVSRITFWMNFFFGNEEALVKTFRLNPSLIDLDISQTITPKITFLQSHGLSTQLIRWIASRVAHFITSDISEMEDILKRTKELGFPPGSYMFVTALKAVASVSREGMQKNMDLLMSFGWSEDELFAAVRMCPQIVALKEENLRAKMDFLLGEAKCPPSSIASRPKVLTFSLENRLRPRHHDLHLLETRGFICQEHQLYHQFLHDVGYSSSYFRRLYSWLFRKLLCASV